MQYAVPVRSNMLLMFYNRAHYKKAGLPEPTPMLTWEQYLAQAPKLVQDMNGDGVIDAWAVDTFFVRDQLTPTIWQGILNANGGSLLDGRALPPSTVLSALPLSTRTESFWISRPPEPWVMAFRNRFRRSGRVPWRPCSCGEASTRRQASIPRRLH